MPETTGTTFRFIKFIHNLEVRLHHGDRPWTCEAPREEVDRGLPRQAPPVALGAHLLQPQRPAGEGHRGRHLAQPQRIGGQRNGGRGGQLHRDALLRGDAPVPLDGEGVLSPGEAAVVQFDVIVDATATPGTLITNQATVYSLESGDVLTDGDGNPATGPEPTVVVVGDVQQVSILKEVSVVDGGTAMAGSTLEYVVTVRNIGTVPAFYVEIQDDLSVPNPNYLAYIDGTATMNGLAAGVTVNGTLITAEPYELTRTARIDDVGGILELIMPMESAGVLVKRSRELLEQEIEGVADTLATGRRRSHGGVQPGAAERCEGIHRQQGHAAGRVHEHRAHAENVVDLVQCLQPPAAGAHGCAGAQQVRRGQILHAAKVRFAHDSVLS